MPNNVVLSVAGAITHDEVVQAASALMDVFPLYRAFEANSIVPWLRLESEKNVFAPSPIGTSAGALDTAPHVAGDARPVPQS
mgnify:CR=1 FL=1